MVPGRLGWGMAPEDPTRRRFLRAGASALMVAGIAGCTGDGSDGPTATDSPTPSPTDTVSATPTPSPTATASPTPTPTPTPTSPFELENEPGEYLSVVGPEGPVGRYMYVYDPSRRQETYKTYLHVIDPETGGLLTSGPTGRYDHHRGIFIGWNDFTVDGTAYDFWHFDGGGRMVHDTYEAVDAFPRTGTLTSINHWITPGEETAIEESRSMTFREPPSTIDGGIVVIDFASTLAAQGSDVELLGDPEHAGIQYRPHNDVSENETAEYIFPPDAFSSENPSNSEINSKEGLRWAAQTHTIRDQGYFVQHMNHPDNPEDTVYSAYRPYGRFGAFFEETVPAGESLTVRYRFLIKRGDAPPVETLETLYEEYAGGSEA